MRFRRFRSRLVFFLVLLLTLLQAATYLLVRQANRQHALTQIEARLRGGARIFGKLIEQRNQQLADAAAIVSRDHAFQEAFAGADQDRATTLSGLESLQARVKADVVLIASLDKELLFDTRRPELHRVPFPFPRLLDRAALGASAHDFVFLGDELDAMAVTPLLAPEPIAWLCPAFRVDDDFAREIKVYTDLEITFLDGSKFFATTFDQTQKSALSATLQSQSFADRKVTNLRLGDETFLAFALPLPVENGKVIALLQRSLDRELAPFLRLERSFLLLALIGLGISVALGIWIARGVSRPVLQLADGAAKIAQGDYQHRVELNQQDELGTLAKSFNHMSEGLAERDRVRDLLGIVVSPEVAAELLRNGVALGGDEREVTILFSDLRDFTAMSETLPPQETVAILNDYFTRMSAIVESHGGVVDKYVGDGLMALFGAPVADPEGTDHALAAALEMCDALEELNREWQSRGLAAIDLGVGINTDQVVAGNMGSERRLNYTVIGDGVNLASRLQSLTRNPDYNSRIIVSSATIAKAKGRYRTRPLGEVAVKGRQKATAIFALLGRG